MYEHKHLSTEGGSRLTISKITLGVSELTVTRRQQSAKILNVLNIVKNI